MLRKILIFSYWFPPNNIIGATRPSAIAQFFSEQGWDVTVICADSSATERSYIVDLENVTIHRVKDTLITELVNFQIDRTQWRRALSAALRLLNFPDGFKTTTSRMERVANNLIEKGCEFDVVLSSALPFSLHRPAARIAKKTNALLVLDNRDTWACSRYQRRLPFTEPLERRYEAKTLTQANLIISLSEGMTEYYKKTYPEFKNRIKTIRNGIDNPSQNITAVDESEYNRQLRVVYTGIFYGNKRDVRPVLEATQKEELDIAFDFYGSESEIILELQKEFPDMEIVDHGRVSRDISIEAQRSSSAVLIALGTDEFEKTFLPGKFFEYVGSGRPIMAIADPDSEISQLIVKHELGIATRDPKLLAVFLDKLAKNEIPPRKIIPVELLRSYQLQLLENHIINEFDQTN